MSGGPSARTLRVRNLALLVLLGWTLVAFGRESWSALRGREQSPQLLIESWLLGGPQSEPLQELLNRAEELMPEDAKVLVVTDGLEGYQRHILRMWCVYYLPRHRFGVPATPGFRADFVLSHPPDADGRFGETLVANGYASLHRRPADGGGASQ